jgi:serine/threonine protein phosphatase PrpC
VSSETIVTLALVVLAVAGVLLLLELRGARLDREMLRAPPRDRAPKPVGSEAGEEELTLIGHLPRLPVFETSSEEGEEGEDYTPSTAMTFFEEGAEIDEPTGSKKIFVVWAAGQTDRGRSRRRNEDSILLLGDYSVFVVADGMGGYAGGDVASKIAVESIENAYRTGNTIRPGKKTDRPARGDELVVAMESANEAIRAESRRRSDLGQMGATIIGARFLERKQRAFISHVGDSRCYRLRTGQLRLLTKDHTMAAKGVPGKMGDHVRRALGVSDRVAVDLLVDRPLPNDVYLLCSDGLNKMVDDDRIAEILNKSSQDLDSAVRVLIDEANEHGGKDNISVILVGVRPTAKAA